jgi:hypothetical protein
MMRFLRRWVFFPILFVLALPLVALAGLPWPWILRWVDPPATAFMLHREREARGSDEDFTLVQDWVRLDELPEHLVRAVLVAEDDRFREHGGVDWKALAEEVRWSGGEDFSWRSAEDREALRNALAYYRDFVRPNKQFRAPDDTERAALADLRAELGKLPPDAAAEAIHHFDPRHAGEQRH